MVERCIAPHEIQEGDLVAYIEGAASPEVNRHITRCLACTAEAETLRRVDSMFSAVLGQAGVPIFAEASVTGAEAALAPLQNHQTEKARSGFRLAWPSISLSRFGLQPAGVVLGAVVLLGSILTVSYVVFNQAQFETVMDEDTAQITDGAGRDVIQTAVGKMQVAEVPASTSIVIENPDEIVPSRRLLKMLRKERPGVVEAPSEIVPPRDLVKMLENELQTKLDDRTLVYSPVASEKYWSESLVVDPESGHTYLVWIEDVDGLSTIFAARSTGEGQILSEGVPISQGLDRAFNPLMAIDLEGNLYVVWRNRYHINCDLYFARSSDGGHTWSRSIRINEEIRRAFNPSLAVDTQGHLYVAWQNQPGLKTDIYLTHSSDGGQTWSKERRVAN